MLNLRTLTSELIESGWHRGGDEAGADDSVIKAINGRHRDIADRKKSLVEWLNRYRVLMGFVTATRTSIADQILSFADERVDQALPRNKERIVAEFNRLKGRIDTVSPLNKNGERRDTISLTSKALWCCYPNDVPIYDRNAACSLGFISRVCRLAPQKDQSEYGRFIDLWFQVYDEIEPVIDLQHLADCPYKVRLLDRLLWYLGQPGFYVSEDASAD